MNINYASTTYVCILIPNWILCSIKQSYRMIKLPINWIAIFFIALIINGTLQTKICGNNANTNMAIKELKVT